MRRFFRSAFLFKRLPRRFAPTAFAPTAEANFRDQWAILALSIASTAIMLPALWRGDIDINYQGDQGARIYDAVHAAITGWAPLLTKFKTEFFGFHPPGDFIARFLLWDFWSLANPGAANPVGFNLAIGVFAGCASLFFLGLAARHVAGLFAGALTIVALSASFVFNDVRGSAQAEAFYYPLFSASFYYLVRALDPAAVRPAGKLVLSAVLALLSSLFRPELMFLLPGICLAIWVFIGFWRAVAHGAIASAYLAVQLAYPYVFSKPTLTLFNAHSYYFTPQRSWWDLPATAFMRQLLVDPAGWYVAAGGAAAVIVALAGRRSGSSWRFVVVLGGTALLYVAIISTAIVNELTTHNSYRLAMPAIHLLIPVFAVSLTRVGGWLLLETGRFKWSGQRPARILAACITAVGMVALIHEYVGNQLDMLKRRGLPDGSEAVSFMLDRLEPGQTIYFDRMFYWENVYPAFFAHHAAPLCTYSRCPDSQPAAYLAWKGVRNDNAPAGSKVWAEFAALRSHVFIRNFRPTYILMPNGELYQRWVKQAKRLWPQDWQVWHSHLAPYLMQPIDFGSIQPGIFLHLGTVEGRVYFDDYVYLVPEFRTKNLIVFKAEYGRRPT